MSATTTANRPSLLEQTLLYHLWQDFRTRWLFKFTLPKLQTTTLEGVKLDVSQLSSFMKNNLVCGRYEVQERKMAQQYLTSGDAVLEVGGGIGYIGLFCQLNLGIKRYTTVEANPKTVKLLERNYELNGRKPTVWNLALADDVGEVSLNLECEFWENSLVTTASESTARVPSVSLANLLRRLNYEPTALIIDIEGAEQFVDFSEVPANVKKIIIELHPAFIGHAKTYRIVADLINLGFRAEREEGGTFCFLRQ